MISEDFFENGQKNPSNLFEWKKGWCWNTLVRNGQKQFEEHYIDGKKEGLLPHGFENGKCFTKKISKNDKRHGISKVWYDNGQEESENQLFQW